MGRILAAAKLLAQYPKHLLLTLMGYRRIDLADPHFYMHKSAADHMGPPIDEIICAPMGYRDGKPVYLTSELPDEFKTKMREFYDEDGHFVVEYRFPAIARTNERGNK